MSELESPRNEDGLGESPTPFGEASIVDLLKQDLQDLQESKETFLPIVGWERTGLAIKYHLPSSGKDLDAIARKVFRETTDKYLRNLYVSMDTMVFLSGGLYVKPAGISDEYVELDPEERGYPLDLKDGPDLIGIFGWSVDEIKNARQVVRKLFGNNEISILAHAEKLQRWMQNTKADINTEIWELGE